jgi:CRP-like cAMP-binding protein
MSVFGVATGRAQDRTKTLDWRSLLARHRAFSCLSETETDELLGVEASQERNCASGSEIVRQGAAGDSCFLIGAGSMQVQLDGPSGSRVTLSTLRKGDVFGEMAAFDRKPRAASVTAAQDSVLLEIEGPVLREMIVGHPDLELALLVELTDKLRDTNDRLLALNLRDTDEALKLFDAKLSAEVRVFDAALKASQVVFEQTKIRADEVITSAEHNRSRTTTMASLAGTVLTLLSVFGVKQVVDLKDLADKNRAALAGAQSSLKDVEELKGKADGALSALKKAEAGAARARQILVKSQLVPALAAALGRGLEADAIDTFETLVTLAAFDEDAGLLPRLLNEAEQAIMAGGAPEPAVPPRMNPDFTTLLGRILSQAQEPRSRARAYTLLLANAALAKCGQVELDIGGGAHATWADVLGQFESFAREHRGEALLHRDELASFEPHLRRTCPQKLEPLQRAMALIRAA